MKANYFYKLCAVAYPATKLLRPSLQPTIANTYDYDKGRGKSKGKVFPVHDTELYYRVELQLQPFLTSALDLSHYFMAAVV
jgi:hypothetical protein